MPAIKFDFKPVMRAPARKYTKKSKYDPVIDRFLDSSDRLWQVNVENVDANYLRTQINKRIKVRDLTEDIKVFVINDIVHLEKL